ncbi:OmpW/AlkL family protein [Aliamphritea ceti]|uniref:OmpW/AlkL family protein n=1 Tax=Aliamphritea ceti TaxID=1524258 RepID=UPI0021C3E6AE|nr:OmpW family outer membrane protein [Aliamphritea ceti]
MKTSAARLGLTAAILATLTTAPAFAYEAGDIIVRAGATNVNPNDDSSAVSLNGSAVAGSGVSVNSDTQLGLTATYMLDSNWGIELLAATPFSHDISGKGTLAGQGKIASAKQLPPTLSAVYYFDTEGAFDPYIGAGINYTTFFSEEGEGNFTGYDVKLDDSWGLAVQAGFDVQLSENWQLNGSVRYIDIQTDATISNGTNTYTVDVDIDPTVVSMMIGYKF